jgi:cytochrome c oxidase assembly protein subunit 15
VALGLLFPNTSTKPHPLYRRTLALTVLVTLTVISGGFVAGLKAGFAFNTFPLMNGKWIPDQLLALQPAWSNLFDNPVTVQFDHRVLAITTLVAVIVYWVSARGQDMPARVRTGVHALLVVTVIQVVLGISTLLMHVPVHLAATHQAVAMLVFTVAVYLCHGLWRSSVQVLDA